MFVEDIDEELELPEELSSMIFEQVKDTNDIEDPYGLFDMFCITKDDLIFNREKIDYADGLVCRNLNRVECAFLIYLYRYKKCDMSFQILFEESLIVFKKMLKGFKFKTLNYDENDLFHDFYIYFKQVVDTFKITENHSFKKYLEICLIGFIKKLYSEVYFFVHKNPVSYRSSSVEITEFNSPVFSEMDYIDNFVVVEDTIEQNIINKDSERVIKETLDKIVKSKNLTQQEIDIFCSYNGICTEEISTQKEIALIHKCSISNVSKKNKKVKEYLAKIEIDKIINGEKTYESNKIK